jgi:CRP/FNR family transcriptional regulator, cyclic AMP receptor protein
MNKFRDLGFIAYNGKLEVHTSLLSVVLSDRPTSVRSFVKPSRKDVPSAAE